MEERIVSIDELSNDNVEIVKVPMDDKGGVLYIGSLSTDDFVEWQEAQGNAEEKKTAAARLIVKSLVKGPDKAPDGKPLVGEQLKAAAARTGSADMVPKLRKAKMSRSELILKAILKLNGINQAAAVATKNA